MSKELSSGDRSSWDHKARGSDRQGWQKIELKEPKENMCSSWTHENPMIAVIGVEENTLSTGSFLPLHPKRFKYILSHVIHCYFPCFCEQTLVKKQLKGRRLVWAYTLRECGWWWQGEEVVGCEATGHIVSAIMKHKEMDSLLWALSPHLGSSLFSCCSGSIFTDTALRDSKIQLNWQI